MAGPLVLGAMVIIGTAVAAQAIRLRLDSQITQIQQDLPQYLFSGPYTVLHSTGQLLVAPSVACSTKGYNLTLTLTSPARVPELYDASVPVVIMFSGFQLPSSYYKTYAKALASWGYAVLQYDLPGWMLKTIIKDDDEVACLLPALLTWVKAQSRDPNSAIYEMIDLRRVGVMGHSRGAKLAALILAGAESGVSVGVLVDPMDMTRVTKQLHYPSAVEALADSSHKPVSALLIGAGVQGWCNPADEGWKKFQPVLSGWMLEVTKAGHMSFTDAKGAAAWSWDHVCGCGNVTHKVVMHEVGASAVAWMESKFRPVESAGKVASYLAWARAGSGQGEYNFTTPPEPTPPEPAPSEPAPSEPAVELQPA
eukprot:CAMPEP_0119105626 /NCGR_PEP_ID=MMETSP1180-20130426/3541_1 /TAXON_ID=3052 ORGANISM="Chlamydomonas cf sp, Strain CCMP681" /NCGR_SAMPLE_ID=MMETSP1180 /ASSEMBLY_ACC=CAM_ASM_000741 /LENGTH=365 /DNA_ID=CAMNT_0007090727 /DNA_START=57 /DNA_END=1154 /DNA_ORIENTATION=-